MHSGKGVRPPTQIPDGKDSSCYARFTSSIEKRQPYVNVSSPGDRDLAVASFSLSARPAL